MLCIGNCTGKINRSCCVWSLVAVLYLFFLFLKNVSVTVYVVIAVGWMWQMNNVNYLWKFFMHCWNNSDIRKHWEHCKIFYSE